MTVLAHVPRGKGSSREAGARRQQTAPIHYLTTQLMNKDGYKALQQHVLFASVIIRVSLTTSVSHLKSSVAF